MKRLSLYMALVLVGGLAARVWAPELRAQETQKSGDISVVVNANNPINDISLAALRKILLGETAAWKNHSNVVLVLRPEGTPERETAIRVLAHMTGPQFKQHWMGRVFRAESSAEPLTVASKGVMLEYVGSQEGGIAFIETPKMLPHIKVITVDNLKPGDPKYPLR